MKAVILAAGIASRLRPLTDHTPKCLLMAGEKNILSRTLDNLVSNGITDLILVTGYLEMQIRKFVSEMYPDLKVTFLFNEVYDSTNNIYSLWLTKKHIAGYDLLLLDSDIVFDRNIISQLLAAPYPNCLALKKHDVGQEEIKVKTDVTGRVLKISKEVIPAEAAGESIGIEKFGKESVKKLFQILDRKILQEKNVNIFYEAAFQELVEEGDELYVEDVTRFSCMEIDTAADLEAAGQLLANHKSFSST